MKLNLFLLLVFHVGIIQSQAVFEYWFDNDYEQKISTSELPESISTGSLNNGFHTVNFRYYSEYTYSPIYSSFFLKSRDNLIDFDNDVTEIEYWFNDKLNEKHSFPFNDRNSIYELINTNSLPDGIHSLHIRLKDTYPKGPVISSFFYKKNHEIQTSPEITAYRYWIDNQYNDSLYKISDEETIININGVNLNRIENSLHTISFQFLDSKNLWSSPISKYFYKVPELSSSDNKIIKYRYRLDNQSFIEKETKGNNYLVLDTIINNIPIGIHSFEIQFSDSKGNWNNLSNHFFYKSSEKSKDKIIKNYRYWINNEFDLLVDMDLENPIRTITIDEDIDINEFPKGKHILHFQFSDGDLWSSIITDTINKETYPPFEVFSDFYHFCDSGNIQIAYNGSPYVEKVLWDYGDRSKITNKTSHFYAAPGEYLINASVFYLGTKDSVVHQANESILIFPSYQIMKDTILPLNSYLELNDKLIDKEGEYRFNHQTINGCDSIVIINLSFGDTEAIYTTNYEKVITISPNPVKEILYIHSKNSINNIQLFDVNGNNTNFISSSVFPEKEIQLNVNSLPSGLYILFVETGKGTFSQKIIKQ